MLSRGVLRAVTQGACSPAIARAATCSPLIASRSFLAESRRAISTYGYTQSKALIYSKYGEPKDVLS